MSNLSRLGSTRVELEQLHFYLFVLFPLSFADVDLYRWSCRFCIYGFRFQTTCCWFVYPLNMISRPLHVTHNYSLRSWSWVENKNGQRRNKYGATLQPLPVRMNAHLQGEGGRGGHDFKTWFVKGHYIKRVDEKGRKSDSGDINMARPCNRSQFAWKLTCKERERGMGRCWEQDHPSVK